jgi:predicted MFS family arabinose efflux permease
VSTVTVAEVLAPARARGGRRNLYLVAFAAAAVGAGVGRAVTTTYLPLLLDRIESSPGLIGLVMLVNAGAGLSVPLVVGYWSDRRKLRGLGGRLPFVVGGTVVTVGGLVAVALGASSSYLALAVFGATVYIGLNAITTAHRTLVAELFVPGERARATSAQELALLVGSMLGLVAGGVLADIALWAPFLAAAVLLPLLVLPTLLRVTEPKAIALKAGSSHPFRFYREAATKPGVRALLVAELLWVFAYAALPTFFILYAERVLGLDTAAAAIGLAGFGVVTAAFTVAAGRISNPDQLGVALFLGVALMGTGLLAVSLTTSLALVSPALIAAAAGFGIISTTGFPVLTSIIPTGEAGGYTALFFSVRAIGSAAALPLAGGVIAFTESYRSLFVLGGSAALLALVPLTRIVVHRPAWTMRLPSTRWLARWAGSVAGLYLAVLATGLVVATTVVAELDRTLFRAVNAFGPGPEPLFELLEEPGRNYLLLLSVPVAAALLAGPRRIPGVLALEIVAGTLAIGLLEGVYALYDRPRPSEVFEGAEIVLAYGHDWARIEAFPSGHMAVITALAAATWFVFPRLRYPLIGYVALNAVTRVLFGAHFPLDVVGGIVLGYGSALAARALFVQTGLFAARAPAPQERSS